MYRDKESKLMLEKMYPVTEAPIPSASAVAETWTVLKDIAVEPTLYNHLTKIATQSGQTLQEVFQEMFTVAANDDQVANWIATAIMGKPWAAGFQDQLAVQPPLQTPSLPATAVKPLHEPTPGSDDSAAARLRAKGL